MSVYTFEEFCHLQRVHAFVFDCIYCHRFVKPSYFGSYFYFGCQMKGNLFLMG